MKKIKFLTCLAILLSLVACTNELDSKLSVGEEVSVSFTANLLNDAQTRAFTDGSLAGKLSYAVFVSGQNTSVLSGVNNDASTITANSDGTWNINISLVKGLSYDIVFWAQNEEAPYTFVAESGIVEANYGDVLANDDRMDAFYHTELEFLVEGPTNKVIELRRAVAQINVGASDYDAAKDRGVTEYNSSSMTIKSVCPNFDLLSGKAAGTPQEVTFKHNDLESIDGTFNVNGTDYQYLTRNYIFADGNIELSFEVKYNGSTATLSYDKIANVPVKKNFRTNIYGDLILNPQTLSVSIGANFWAGETNVELIEVKSKEQLDAALEANKGKDVNIKYTGKPLSGDQEINIPNEYKDKNVALDLPALEGAEDTYTIKSSVSGTISVTVPADESSKVKVDAEKSTVTVNGQIADMVSKTSENTLILGAGTTITNLTVEAGNVKMEGDAKLENIINKTGGIIYLIKSAAATLPETIPATVEVVNSEEERNLRKAIANGTEYTLQNDIYAYREFGIPAGKTVTIDLNGHNITVDATSTDVFVNYGGTLTVKGEGNVTAVKQNGYAVVARGGITNLENGRYESVTTGAACVYAMNDAVVNISGGYYKVGGPHNGNYFVLNLQDGSAAKINVTGGIFENFNPAQSLSENPQVNFVVSGYESMQISGTNNYEVGQTYRIDENGNYEILSANGLRWFASEIAVDQSKFAKKTIKLMCDVDLSADNWTSIKFWNPGNPITFDGNNHIISGLNNMLFSNGTINIKNLILENVNINTTGPHVGGLVGNLYGNIENVHIKNSSIKSPAWNIAGLIGIHNSGNMKNCSAENVKVEALVRLGALVGFHNETENRKYENCSVDGAELIHTRYYGVDFYSQIGSIVGCVHGNMNLTIEGCKASNVIYKEIVDGETKELQIGDENGPWHELHGAADETLTVID